MSDITIYHNPACGTSRNVLEMIQNMGFKPKVVEYLKTPLNRNEISALLRKMKISARDLIRDKGDLYQELDLANSKWSEEQLIGLMEQHPVLMNRPVVVTALGVRLCRPKETVLEILAKA